MIGRILTMVAVVGLILLLGLGVWYTKSHSLSEVPSPLIGKPAPEFTAPILNSNQPFSSAELKGKPWILNVFASWCTECGAEHPLLLSWAAAGKVTLVGLNWKDKDADATAWLARMGGNPYQIVATDADGRIGINFGVYGVPETYVINAQGIIVYKHIGALTDEVITQEIQPRLAEKN